VNQSQVPLISHKDRGIMLNTTETFILILEMKLTIAKTITIKYSMIRILIQSDRASSVKQCLINRKMQILFNLAMTEYFRHKIKWIASQTWDLEKNLNMMMIWKEALVLTCNGLLNPNSNNLWAPQWVIAWLEILNK
jgi:hypothetical protein